MAEPAHKDKLQTIKIRLDEIAWQENPLPTKPAHAPSQILLPFSHTEEDAKAIWEWLNGQSEL